MQIEMTIKGLMVDPITNIRSSSSATRRSIGSADLGFGCFEANAIALQIENVRPRGR